MLRHQYSHYDKKIYRIRYDKHRYKLYAMDNIDETSGGAIESTVRKAGQQFMTFSKKRIPRTEGKKRESQADALKNQMTKEIAANKEELADLQGSRSISMKQVNENKDAVISGRNVIQELREKSAKERKEGNLNGSLQTYAKQKATEEKFYGSQPYRDHQKATAAVHAIDSQISSKKTKGDAMQETLDSVENAEKALEQAPAKEKGKMQQEFERLETPEQFKGFSEQYTKANPTK